MKTPGPRESPTPAFGPGREFEVIASILEGRPRFDLRASKAGDVPPGDDAAVLANGTVLSTDLAIEGVHFDLGWISARQAGYRAAAAGVSDLAAMAAEPVGILASVGVPGDGALAGEVMAGVKSLAASLDMALLGGDLARSPDRIVVDVVSVGRTEKPLLRSGVRVGDELWVTGALGGAAAAVTLWQAGQPVPEGLAEAFSAPTPRITEALWLAEAGATAAIDLSDGLAGDAGHLAAASVVALVIEEGAVPMHPGLAGLELPLEIALSELALSGGDDFELLIAAPAGSLDARLDEFRERFALPLTRIGMATEGRGVEIRGPPRTDGRTAGEANVPVGDPGGYDHFRDESRA